jgi:Skp family chaperone for outer membrane proteins
MKKIAMAAKMLLVVLAAGLVSCGNGEKTSTDNDSAKNVSGTKLGDAYETTINIRYVDMDSLYKHYEFAVEQQAKVQQIAVELQQYQNQLARNLQTKQSAVQQKLQNNGYLSEASYKADVEELNKLDQSSSAQYSRRAQVDEQRVYELNKALSDAIDEYIIEYNKEHHYDAILHKEVGLYFNPALDITGELVAGLNAAYKAKKGDKAEKADDKKADSDKK